MGGGGSLNQRSGKTIGHRLLINYQVVTYYKMTDGTGDIFTL